MIIGALLQKKRTVKVPSLLCFSVSACSYRVRTLLSLIGIVLMGISAHQYAFGGTFDY